MTGDRGPTLATDRLVLRPFCGADVAAYTALVGDAEAMRHIGDGSTVAPSAAWTQLGFLIGHWELRGHGPFAVVRRSDGAVIGRVGTLHPPDLDQPELAWLLARHAWGQGFGREAVAAARDWALGPGAVPDLVSWITPQNERSRRLATSLGASLIDERDRHGRRFLRFRFAPEGHESGST